MLMRNVTRLKSQMADGLQYLNSLNTRRYRCCCGAVHVKRGALVVGTVELFVAAAALAAFTIAFFTLNPQQHIGVDQVLLTTTAAPPSEQWQPSSSISYFTFAGVASLGLLYVLAVLIMFYGVRHFKARFVLPHLVVQVLTVLALAAAVVLSILVLATGHFVVRRDDPEAKVSDRTELLAVVVLIASCICFAFQIWFLNVVYKCYRYLRDKEAHLRLFSKAVHIVRRKSTYPITSRPFSPSNSSLLPWIDAVEE